MISFNDFFKNEIEQSLDVNYANHIFKYVRVDLFIYRLMQGFILWNKADAHNWAGPWLNKAALCLVTDYRFDPKLKSIYEKIEHWRTYEQYNKFNLPYKFQKELEKNMILISNSGDKCSRSQMTYEEKQHILKQLTTKELEEYNLKITKKIIYHKSNIYIEPTIEHPIEIYLCGNDDTSYTYCCENVERAKDIINQIEINPNFKKLKSLGFKFTN
jgi:hypothetical protein